MARAVRSGTRLDTALVALCGASAFLVSVLPPNLRDPVAGALRRSVVAPLIVLQKNAELGRAALLSHDAAMRVRDSVALRAQSVTGLENENERLRRLVGLGSQLKWGFVPAEALHGRALGEEYTLTLTAGSNQGVTAFSPVIAPEGLVGMVQTVDPTMSLAIIWPHPDFRVSAQTVDGTAYGIVAAHLGSGGPERFLLELRGVPFRSPLKPGTLVVSSGFGGVYPKGIPLGNVLGEVKTSEGWARTYLLRSAVFPPDISSVLILQPKRGDAGVASIWTPEPARDSSVARTDSAGTDTAVKAVLPPASRPALRKTSAAGTTSRSRTPAVVKPAPRPRSATQPGRPRPGR